MSAPGDDRRLLIAARKALLDALDALAAHRDALVLVGAQAIYLHTGAASTAVAEATKDSDLAVDPRLLEDFLPLDELMQRAGFHHDFEHPQPGSWVSPDGIPVDLLVPERLAGPGAKDRRGARIPPHAPHATRRTPGLEAAVVDHAPQTITALDDDPRRLVIEVAGPAALLVAKLHKIGERRHAPGRLIDKDAHDTYRLLIAVETVVLAERLKALRDDELAGDRTEEALVFLDELFAGGPDAVGSQMAGRAEQLVGDPEVVSGSVAALAADVLEGLRAATPPGR